MCLAKEQGVIDGYPDGTFLPEQTVSFAEAAKILRNTMLADEALVKDPKFTQWYEPYVNALSVHGDIPVSIRGYDAWMTRGEMAEMIYRLDAKLDMLTSLSILEMGDRALIESYYAAIAAKKYEQAYDMKVDPGVTLDGFTQMYTGFPWAGISDYRKVGPHTFEFRVTTQPNLEAANEDKARQERYAVTMQVIDGKLKTISSAKVTDETLEEIIGGADTENAWLKWENGVYKIYLRKDGKDTVVAQYDTIDRISISVGNLKFSPTGKYLTWQIFDWEHAAMKVYDIAQKKESDFFMGIELWGFTANDANFYFCSSSGMSSGEVTVVDFPGFGSVHHIEDGGTGVIWCDKYDPATRTLTYHLTGNDGTVKDVRYEIK